MVREEKIFPVILAGGSGTRLWPNSRKHYPKQFLNLIGPTSPFQETLNRTAYRGLFHPPTIITNEEYRFLAGEQSREVLGILPTILLEPSAKNTLPSVVFAGLHIMQNYTDGIMLILPSDHIVEDKKEFHHSIRIARNAAYHDGVVAFGVKPTHPEKDYGYINAKLSREKKIYKIDSFIEKPNKRTASHLIESGALWNSGMFVVKASALLHEIEKNDPEIHSLCSEAYKKSFIDLDFIRLDKDAFSKLPSLSIDRGLMERTPHSWVVPLDCGWSDIGSWNRLWGILPKDQEGNVRKGRVYSHDTQDCYLETHEAQTLALLGMRNAAVIVTPDVVWVANKDRMHGLKDFLHEITVSAPELIVRSSFVHRPWGYYKVLVDGGNYQIKYLHIRPGMKLSLQIHRQRSEHWTVLQGRAKIVIGNKSSVLKKNQSVYIPPGKKHRIENISQDELEIIEIQSGDYLSEDDIVRFKDEYGRN